MESAEAFSDELEHWLEADRDKTLGDLQTIFRERTFAVTILLLMAPAALPLPTGGVTHVLQLATLLLALEMVAGHRTVWLPSRWSSHELGSITTDRAIPAVIRFIRWCERWSRPRGTQLLGRVWTWHVLGALIGVLTVTAALAPPFSGLDTLPALGVVLIALAILLQDLVLAIVGVVVGATGAALIVLVGAAIARALRSIF